MDDLVLLHNHGHMLVKGLLSMLLELKKVNATLHNLTPDGIYVSGQGTRLTVVNLFNVTYPGMRTLGMIKGSMPYGN